MPPCRHGIDPPSDCEACRRAAAGADAYREWLKRVRGEAAAAPGTCANCGRPYKAKSGRGLCRQCWRQPQVRARFKPLAAFGGRGASKIGHARRGKRG